MMNLAMMAMRAKDWPSVREIYAEGIATGNATFETAVPGWARWDSAHHQHCRLIARDSQRILGWAALSPVSSRRVYAGVAEVSIYVAGLARGKGVGKALMKSLIDCSEKHGMWTLQAGIFPENVASIALHKSCGFREVGLRQRLAQLAGRWRDVLLLERRSPSIAR
ncbi:MAG TPA: GNAT family N-acetyltransferase [Terriglobales bacterium]|nr:GNAT family N-acetyltransferase [Terriglobales bacterium]